MNHAQMIATVDEQFENSASDYAKLKKLRADLSALQADRDSLWDQLYQPHGEVSRLRDALTEAQQENTILREELAQARQMAGMLA